MSQPVNLISCCRSYVGLRHGNAVAARAHICITTRFLINALEFSLSLTTLLSFPKTISNRMRFSITVLVVGLFTCKSLGGSLQVIDDNRECKIYSSDNHGCTGYSAPFAKLDGDDCSSIFKVKLIIARNTS